MVEFQHIGDVEIKTDYQSVPPNTLRNGYKSSANISYYYGDEEDFELNGPSVEGAPPETLRNGYKFAAITREYDYDDGYKYEITDLATGEVHPFTLDNNRVDEELRRLFHNFTVIDILVRGTFSDVMYIDEIYVVLRLLNSTYMIVNWHDSSFIIKDVQEFYVYDNVLDLEQPMKIIGNNLYIYRYFEGVIYTDEYNIVDNTIKLISTEEAEFASAHIEDDEGTPVIVSRANNVLDVIDVSTGERSLAIQHHNLEQAVFINRDLILFDDMLYVQGREHETNINGPWQDVFVRDNTLYAVPDNSVVITNDVYKYNIYAIPFRRLVTRAKSARK